MRAPITASSEDGTRSSCQLAPGTSTISVSSTIKRPWRTSDIASDSANSGLPALRSTISASA
jgi:hypothetical protein